MSPPGLKPATVPGDQNDSPAPRLRRIVRMSALLNLVIVLTSCPVLVFAGGTKAAVLALAVMAGISILIWTATFTLYLVVSLPRIFGTPVSSGKTGDLSYAAKQAGSLIVG